MSAMPPVATKAVSLSEYVAMCQSRRNAPREIAALFDHLVGTCEQCRRHCCYGSACAISAISFLGDGVAEGIEVLRDHDERAGTADDVVAIVVCKARPEGWCGLE